MKLIIISFVFATILLGTAYVSYRFGQSDGYEMGFTGGLHANMKTIYDSKLNKDGVFTITKRELEDTLRGTQNLMYQSGASSFVSWKWKKYDAGRVECREQMTVDVYFRSNQSMQGGGPRRASCFSLILSSAP